MAAHAKCDPIGYPLEIIFVRAPEHDTDKSYAYVPRHQCPVVINGRQAFMSKKRAGAEAPEAMMLIVTDKVGL